MHHVSIHYIQLHLRRMNIFYLFYYCLFLLLYAESFPFMIMFLVYVFLSNRIPNLHTINLQYYSL